jgi:nuclear transport factor 2 (NTF2) superfamily protein
MVAAATRPNIESYSFNDLPGRLPACPPFEEGLDATATAQSWLAELDAALSSNDEAKVAALWHSDGFWRDQCFKFRIVETRGLRRDAGWP